MLSREDNELLCRVGPARRWATSCAQYWVPALLSSELPEPDCPPVRVRLLGENLIAFRVTSGKVGLIQNHCPHRGASLFFGRNEEEGLRCVYHGWKFDVRGRLRRHAERAGREQLQDKVRARRLPVRRAQRHHLGLHGPAADAAAAARPRAQHAGSTASTPCRRLSCASATGSRRWRATSTPSHLASCTWAHVKPEDTPPGTFDYYASADRAPRYEVVDTEFGTIVRRLPPAEPDTYYWRIATSCSRSTR